MFLAVECGQLEIPVNGSRQGSLTTFPNTIKFECDEGFILHGSRYRVCQANRTWSGVAAKCIGKD